MLSLARMPRKLLSTLGILMLGDSVAYLISHERHVRVWAWRGGPNWYRKLEQLGADRRSGLLLTAAEVIARLMLVRSAQRAR